ncbi:DUF4397 domain-containing protein [Maledivibacter halophilus]|uniref:DUF4397 domain-containing protein n=1 Tax=Maledivibacter halophilus TaxID=36842 RepID=A0A1T5JBA3_9FIRM|nr:DUF4397 domain-containing protein [Maledivibacter halophilus]SKC48562.1 protein of unknown function [Maledivibacter halophilus]
MYNFYDFWQMNPYRMDFFRRAPIPIDTTYVRIFHASPDAPPVDVYLNNRPVVSNLEYRSFTEYLPVSPGVYNVKVFPAGATRNPVINTNINVPSNTILTVAAINKLEDIALYAIEDTPMPVPGDKVYLRFGHLSPNAPSVDIRLPNGNNVFRDVEYKEITDYKLLDPGTYTLDVYGAGTDKRVLHVPNINLKPNRFYTVYAIGLVGEKPPLQVVIPLDGNSYIKVR